MRNERTGLIILNAAAVSFLAWVSYNYITEILNVAKAVEKVQQDIIQATTSFVDADFEAVKEQMETLEEGQ
jgi:dihydroxyacetone kinase